MMQNIDVNFFKNVLKFEKGTFDKFIDFVHQTRYLIENDINSFYYLKHNMYDDFIKNGYKFDKHDLSDIEKIYLYAKEHKSDKKVDVLRYYGDIENVNPEICPFGLISKIDNVKLSGILYYINNYNPNDEIANKIILDNISLEEVNQYYDRLTETLSNYLEEYKDIIKELENRDLNVFWEYINDKNPNRHYSYFCNFCDYLKENYDKKDKIIKVLDKADELQIKDIDIIDDCDVLDGIYDVSYTQTLNTTSVDTNEKIPSGYIGKDVYTDGDKKWLGVMSTKIYPVEITNAKYVLLKNRKFNSGRLGYNSNNNSFVEVQTKLQVSDFDFDIEDLPSYSELHDFSTMPKIDFANADKQILHSRDIAQKKLVLKNKKSSI